VREGDYWTSVGSEFHSSDALMQRLEVSVDRRLLAGKVAQTAGVTMMIEVGRGRAGQRHKPADSADGEVTCSTRNAMTATMKSTHCGRRSQWRVTKASVAWS